MKRRTFAIQAGPNGRALMAEAIRCFADAAYPPGGSDCAQVARETLLNTAGIIRQGGDAPQVSTRQRSMLRQAMQWFCDNVESLPDASRTSLAEALLALLDGEQVDDAAFIVQRRH